VQIVHLFYPIGLLGVNKLYNQQSCVFVQGLINIGLLPGNEISSVEWNPSIFMGRVPVLIDT
jgi:hypothetical protein